MEYKELKIGDPVIVIYKEFDNTLEEVTDVNKNYFKVGSMKFSTVNGLEVYEDEYDTVEYARAAIIPVDADKTAFRNKKIKDMISRIDNFDFTELSNAKIQAIYDILNS